MVERQRRVYVGDFILVIFERDDTWHSLDHRIYPMNQIKGKVKKARYPL